MTNLTNNIVKIATKIVTRARYVKIQMAKIAVQWVLFGEALKLIEGLRPPLTTV